MSLRLHPEHGVNPTILQCPVCNTDTVIALLGATCKDRAPMHGGRDLNPCKDCQSKFDEYLDCDPQNFIILIVAEEYGRMRLARPKDLVSMWVYFKAAYFTDLIKVHEIFKDFDDSHRKVILTEKTAKHVGIDLKSFVASMH